MDRFQRLAKTLLDADVAGEPMHAEKYNPPHRPAGFSPYDCVVPLTGDDWTEDDADEYLQSLGAKFDRITGVGENDDPRIDSDTLAYVSLKAYNP